MSLKGFWFYWVSVLLSAGRRRLFLAMGLFGLLLLKIFIVDMATVKSIYRILAFMATGLTLVGVSYWYQYLKKQGFFEAIEHKQGQSS